MIRNMKSTLSGFPDVWSHETRYHSPICYTCACMQTHTKIEHMTFWCTIRMPSLLENMKYCFTQLPPSGTLRLIRCSNGIPIAARRRQQPYRCRHGGRCEVSKVGHVGSLRGRGPKQAPTWLTETVGVRNEVFRLHQFWDSSMDMETLPRLTVE